MYAAGEYVVHPGQGVCKVEGVTDDPYPAYRLMPIAGRHALVISLPITSEGKLRPILSHDEALATIDSYPLLEIDSCTGHSGMAEEQYFREMIREGSCADSLRIVKTFRSRIQDARDAGRKPSVIYERILREASSRSFSELAVALGTTPDGVNELFRERLGVGIMDDGDAPA